MNRLSIGFVVSFVLVGVGCSSDSGPGAPADAGDTGVVGATHTVTVGPGGAFSFSPNTMTIKKGDSIKWMWDSTGHNVVSGTTCAPDNKFRSVPAVGAAGATFTFKFDTTGSFPYYCEPHCGTGMTGTITVTD